MPAMFTSVRTVSTPPSERRYQGGGPAPSSSERVEPPLGQLDLEAASQTPRRSSNDQKPGLPGRLKVFVAASENMR